mgnify:FL=1|tara:strand:- start:720 stop:947 length:228 start_codon:yes stop_codon:yes gene_type:complete
MGLIHTMRYLDFPTDSWKQVSVNPTIFEVISNGTVLEIYDVSLKVRKLTLRKGAKIKYMRSVGKYRLTWNDEDLV